MVDMNSTEVANAPPGRFSEETDEVLLLYMAEQESNRVDARDAWEEFYRRHVKYVLWICRRACESRLDEDEMNEVVVDTFRKAYISAATYKVGNLQDPDVIRRKVRAWLGVVAKHSTIDCLRGRRDDEAIQIDPEEWNRIDGNRECQISNDTRIVRKLMAETLDERERAVLWATYLHYDPDKQHQRLPNEVVHDLCARFGTTPANLRRIRKTASGKIRDALEAAGYRDCRNS